MRRITEFARGSPVPAASLNGMQDEQRGLTGGALNPAGARALKGSDGRYLCTPDAGVANGTLVELDASVNWKSRLLSGVFFRLESAAQRLHGADAWQVNDPSRPIAIRRFEGSSGAGGLGAASAAIANGTPPVIAAGSSVVVVDELASSSLRVYLYARPDDGALCLYNASGATLHAEMSLEGSAEAPTPGVSPPTPIPTLTNLLWLTPTVYASRPANPGADVRGVHRSTDTGEVALWDGAAWRVLVSSTVNATQLQGRTVAATAPTNGQALAWNHGASQWEPTTIGGSSMPTAAAADEVPLATGPGTTYTARTMAQLRALLLGPFVDPRTGTGWSANTPSGGASATWGSSKLACVCPSGSAASCGSSKAAYLASGQWYDLAVRIQVIAGNGSTATRVGFAVGPSASSNVSINLWTSGTVECGYFDGATYTAFAFPAGTSSGDRTGGDLWLRITRTPTGVAFAWGVGSAGARPTTWTVIHVATSAVAFLHSGGLRLELFALTTSSLQFEADFLAIESALPGGF